jgi:para-nitrobenzyl esterase
VHFRNIPYAQAPRFGLPEPPPPWRGTRDATRHGPVCPQEPSPITPVMGEPSPAVQDEACLSLSVTVPARPGAARPVMLWLHGGAYAVGGASYEWYRPDALVREGDVIVVAPNYRLGVFGYLRAPGVTPGNLGLLDQIAALRWVRDNIAAFGGDPERITLFGPSAGAHSIVALMSAPETRGLFHRAIAQSPHLGVGFTSEARALRVAEVVQRCLKHGDLRTATSQELLIAQARMQRKLAGPGGFNSVPPFGPIAGVAPLPKPAQTDACSAVLHREVDLMIGTARDEMRTFFDLNPRLVALSRLPGIGPRAYAGLVRGVTQRVFGQPAQRLADEQARAGKANVYLYVFDWSPLTGAFGACHTIDLPFTFGGDAWRGAPMLGNTAWEEIDRLGRALRRAWTQFAHSGDPSRPETPTWPRHTPGAKPGRHWF